jgi:hypothetical protein
VTLWNDDNHLSLSIHLGRARESSLKFSAGLLKLATIVGE